MIAPHTPIAVVQDDATYRTIGYDFDATIHETGHDTAAVLDLDTVRITARREYVIVSYTDRPDPVKIVTNIRYIPETRDEWPDARGLYRWREPSTSGEWRTVALPLVECIGGGWKLDGWIEHPTEIAQ